MNKKISKEEKGDAVSLKPMEVKMIGYEVVEKRAQKSGTSARITGERNVLGKVFTG